MDLVPCFPSLMHAMSSAWHTFMMSTVSSHIFQYPRLTCLVQRHPLSTPLHVAWGQFLSVTINLIGTGSCLDPDLPGLGLAGYFAACCVIAAQGSQLVPVKSFKIPSSLRKEGPAGGGIDTEPAWGETHLVCA